MYAVSFERAAVKALSALPRHAQTRIIAKARALADNPQPAGCKALQGEPGLWRIRVGDYRVIYRVKNEELVVIVVRIARRSERTYRGL